MAEILLYSDTLTSIANAIREKNGKSELLLASDMIKEIKNLEKDETIDTDSEWIKATIINVAIPSDTNTIRSYLFYGCSQLALTELPAGITSISNSAFEGCSQLALTELPAGITSIGSYAFYVCSQLKTITLKGTPDSISTTAFSRCSNLTVINVPWSKGEVAGAPWGATKATINYDYIPEDAY